MAFKRNSGFSFITSQPNSFGLADTFGARPTAASASPDNSSGDKNNTVEDDTLISFSVKVLMDAPASDKRRGELAGRLFALKDDYAAFLEETRACRLDNLGERHDAAVAAARKAAEELQVAHAIEFKASQKWTTLLEESKSAAKRLEAMSNGFSKLDRALYTRSEIAVAQERVEALSAALKAATEVENQAFNDYRRTVDARVTAETAHHAAVSAATSLSKQIDKL